MLAIGSLVALISTLIAAAASAQSPQPRTAVQVPLRVAEPSGLARVDAPVTVGVPLPAGARIVDVGDLQVMTAEGRPVAAQIRPAARWNAPVDDANAALKWVLVDFRASVGAGDTVEYVLTSGATASPAASLATIEDDGIVVNTGPLSFRIARDRFRLVEDVQIDLDGDGAVDVPIVRAGHGGGVRILRTDGSEYRSSEDIDVRATIEENGPLRAVVRIEGRHRLAASQPAVMQDGEAALTDLEFVARVEAWQGKSFIGVTYTVGNPERFLTSMHNRGGAPVAQVFEALSLVLPIATLGDPVQVRFGGDQDTSVEFPDAERAEPPYAVQLPAWATASLYQDSSGGEAWNDGDRGSTFRGWIAEAAEKPLGRGHHAAGWGAVRALGWGVTAGVRNFWQNFPKGLRFSGRGEVMIDLWPAQSRLPHRIEGGRQKTHQIFLDFRGSEEPAEREFLAFSDPLRAAVSSEWLSDSMALGPVVRAIDGDDPMQWVLTRVARSTIDGDGRPDDLWGERARQDLYGWRDFGDSYRAGAPDERHFGNNEFDFGYGLLLQYLLDQQHDRRYLDAAESIFRHLIDIDVYHTDRDAYVYSRGIRQHDSSATVDHSRPPSLSHAWLRGLITWHWISGDPLARDAALEVGGWIEGMIDPATGELAYNGQSRSQAWAALALTELWEMTGEQRYLGLAGRLLAAEVLADQDLPGARYPCAGLDWEGDPGRVDRDDASPWQNGYVAEALGRYAFMRRLAGSADRRAEEGLYRLLDELAVCGFATPDNGLFVAADPQRDNEVYGDRYHSLVIDRRYAPGTWTIEYPNNHLLTDGYAYGALLTSDPPRRRRYLDLARETWRWTMGPETAPGVPATEPAYCCPATPAKTAGIQLRFGQVYLWLLDRLQPSADQSGR